MSHRREMLASCLSKLEPESLMAEGGEKRGAIAIELLKKSCAEDGGTGAEIAQMSGAVRLLMQTCVLHPIPPFRTGATAVLAECVRQGDAAFLRAALDQRALEAFLRLLTEGERRVKPGTCDSAAAAAAQGGALDPDVPTRRVALKALEALLLSAPPFCDEALRFEGTVPTLASLCAHRDVELRRHACALLRTLALDGDGARREAVRAAVELDAEHAAAALLAAALDPEPSNAECAEGAGSVLLSLQGSSAVAAAVAACAGEGGGEGAGDAEAAPAEADGRAPSVRARVLTWRDSLRAEAQPC